MPTNNKLNNCPECRAGILFCRPEKSKEWRVFCTNCNYTVIRPDTRKTQIEIPFEDRRK